MRVFENIVKLSVDTGIIMKLFFYHILLTPLLCLVCQTGYHPLQWLALNVRSPHPDTITLTLRVVRHRFCT